MTPLKGAVFKLEKAGSAPYWGKSNDDGILEWFTDESCTEKLEGTIPIGTYTLTEETAPTGYSKTDKTWTVEIGSGVSITENGTPGSTLQGESVGDILTFTISNDALFSLPSAGGSGIYWYILGGVLLMMAGSLLVYKKRRGEVLRRK